jgi:aerobic carbon-monoxide dehydrogenase medium subunit
MIPAPFEYTRAASIQEAVQKLAAANGAAKIIAGGHSLVPVMKMRLAQPTMLIDIGRIPDLLGIRERNGRIEVGACTVHADVAASSVVRQHAPALSDAAAEIGDAQVRNRGTMGGSIAHADPAADYPAAMLALDARIHLHGTAGERAVAAGEFFKDLMTVDLRPDEIVVAVSFAPAPVSAYAKLHQRASHYAIVGVAAALDVRSGTITSARIGVTGAATFARRLARLEQALAGKPATAESMGVVQGAGAEVGDLTSDLHASAEYRGAMVPVFARRALERALTRVAT